MPSFEINGERRQFPKSLTIGELLEELKIRVQATAIALNGEIVPHSEFAKVSVREGDRIEVIRAVGGG